jgi:hypothetical protein
VHELWGCSLTQEGIRSALAYCGQRAREQDAPYKGIWGPKFSQMTYWAGRRKQLMGSSGAVEGIYNRGLYNPQRITSNTDP